jgi:hypothetical protein
MQGYKRFPVFVTLLGRFLTNLRDGLLLRTQITERRIRVSTEKVSKKCNNSECISIWLWNRHLFEWLTPPVSREIFLLDVTYYYIVLLIGSTCFGHYYAHHQDLTTMMLITTLVVSFLVWCMLEVRLRLGWSNDRAARCNKPRTKRPMW